MRTVTVAAIRASVISASAERRRARSFEASKICAKFMRRIGPPSSYVSHVGVDHALPVDAGANRVPLLARALGVRLVEQALERIAVALLIGDTLDAGREHRQPMCDRLEHGDAEALRVVRDAHVRHDVALGMVE